MLPFIVHVGLAAVMSALVLLVLALGWRAESRGRRPPAKRALTGLSIALALTGLWLVLWPVSAPDGASCGFAAGVLNDLFGPNSPAAPTTSAQPCTTQRWTHLWWALALGVGTVVALIASRRTPQGAITVTDAGSTDASSRRQRPTASPSI